MRRLVNRLYHALKGVLLTPLLCLTTSNAAWVYPWLKLRNQLGRPVYVSTSVSGCLLLKLSALTFEFATKQCCSGGCALDKAKLAGKPSLMSSTSQGVQINQSRPSEIDWKLWRRANTLWSTLGGHLRQPLGPWLLPIKQQRQRHAAYWANFVLWVRIGDSFVQCSQSPDCKMRYTETLLYHYFLGCNT